MEDGLWHEETELYVNAVVLILVVMEDGLWLEYFSRKFGVLWVLILVVMEDSLWLPAENVEDNYLLES